VLRVCPVLLAAEQQIQNVSEHDVEVVRVPTVVDDHPLVHTTEPEGDTEVRDVPLTVDTDDLAITVVQVGCGQVPVNEEGRSEGAAVLERRAVVVALRELIVGNHVPISIERPPLDRVGVNGRCGHDASFWHCQRSILPHHFLFVNRKPPSLDEGWLWLFGVRFFEPEV
jgi:hypothetical protein